MRTEKLVPLEISTPQGTSCHPDGERFPIFKHKRYSYISSMHPKCTRMGYSSYAADIVFVLEHPPAPRVLEFSLYCCMIPVMVFGYYII